MQEFIKPITAKIGSLNPIAISLLVAFIFLLCYTTGVSLAGVSTFGLFLIALQALEFSKEQANSWRHQEAIRSAKKLEEKFNQSQVCIMQALHSAIIFRSDKERAVQYIKNTTPEINENDALNLISTIYAAREVSQSLSILQKKEITGIEDILKEIKLLLSQVDYGKYSQRQTNQVIDESISEGIESLLGKCMEYHTDIIMIKQKLLKDVHEIQFNARNPS